jgi:hypothetical protein
MKHLEFNRKHGKLILEGKKRATFRRRTTAKPGDVVYVHSGGKIIGKARILSVEKRKLDEITDEDAKLDGFNSRDELIEEIQKLYGNLEDIYMIKFDFEPTETKNPYNFHYGNADLLEVAKKALETLDLREKEREILELFLKTGSIRKTAIKLGGWKKRGIVREILRKYSKLLKNGSEPSQ